MPGFVAATVDPPFRTTAGHDQVSPMSVSSRTSTPSPFAAPSAAARTALIRRLANPPKKSPAEEPARPEDDPARESEEDG